MSCKTGDCAGACCHWPFALKKRTTMGQLFPTLPGLPGGATVGPCTTPDGGVGWRTQIGGPCVGASSAGVGLCHDADGQVGWRTQVGGPCVTTIPGELPPSMPGQPAPPGPEPAGFCTLADGSVGYRMTAGGPCVSALQQLPGGVPGQPKPGLPSGIPGTVTEQQCVSREAAAAAAARTAEENKIVKYAAITGVVSGVIGIALGKIF